MQDITQYSDQELTLLIMNTECLYFNRFGMTKETCKEMFIFTDAQ